MSLIFDLENMRREIDAMGRKARRQQEIYLKVIVGVVKLHQEHRIAKNFAVSDSLRAILNDVGIEIVQGTAAYKYNEIPKNLKGRQSDDTWQFRE